MVFLSIEFLVFMVLLLGAMTLIKDRKIQQLLLLGASYFFYFWNDWRMLLLLVAETIVVYIIQLSFGKFEAGKKKKVLLTIGVFCLLVSLGFFKYFNFFASSICNVFGIKDALVLNIILPLGISFYTFQGLSMLYDVYYGKIKVQRDFVRVALCIGMFPQITSGPIVKAKDMLPQLETAKKISWGNIAQGLQIMLIGICKKKVVADRLAVQVDAVFSTPMVYSAGSLALAVIGYSVQLYCDFSGYSEMAIGIAKMLGFDLGKNFNLPYFAKNTSEFWRRWHISLSTWFRDYVYIPLGGSRKGKLSTYRNLFLTMLLSGLWHGASWKFVIWGAAYGVSNSLHKIYIDLSKPYREKIEQIPGKKIRNILAIIANGIVVMVLWIFFRADNMGEAWNIIKRIATGANGVHYYYVYTIVYTIFLMGIETLKYIKNSGNDQYLKLNLNKFGGKLIFCIMLWTIICLAYVGSNAFIYAQF